MGREKGSMAWEWKTCKTGKRERDMGREMGHWELNTGSNNFENAPIYFSMHYCSIACTYHEGLCTKHG